MKHDLRFCFSYLCLETKGNWEVERRYHSDQVVILLERHSGQDVILVRTLFWSGYQFSQNITLIEELFWS